MDLSIKKIVILAAIHFRCQIFATQTEVVLTSRLAEALCSYYESGSNLGFTSKVEPLKVHIPNFDKDCFGYDQMCPADGFCMWNQRFCNDGSQGDSGMTGTGGGQEGVHGGNDPGIGGNGGDASGGSFGSIGLFGVGLEVDSQGLAKVLKGEEAIPFIHPYIVSFHQDLEENPIFHGVLFDAHSVLVVKSHLDDALAKVDNNFHRLRIYTGKHNVFIYEKTEQARYMCKFTDHPQYYQDPNGGCQYCYAIVHLSDPFNFNSLVSKAKFGTPNETELMNDKCGFAGWGVYKDNLKADRLRETFVTGIPCKEVTVDPTHQFCKQASYCWGDSGGPLVCDSDHRLFLSAIAGGTTGSSCATGSLFLDVKFEGFLAWVTSACFHDRGYECRFPNFPLWYGYNYPDPILPSEAPLPGKR